MILLLFVIILIQLFTFWIFEPLTVFLTSILELKNVTTLSLIILIFFWVRENN